MTVLPFGLAYFLAGILVGLTLREAVSIARSGHTVTMTRLGSFVETATARRLGLILVTAALFVNGLLGFLLIDTRADAEDRVECESEFNRQQAIALAARDKRTSTSVRAAIGLWEDLRAQIIENRANNAPTEAEREARTDRVLASIDEYLATLRGAERTRALASFPPPEFCRRLAP